MSTATPTPASHLGRLHVEHDRGLGLGPSRWPLGEIRVGETVTATAEITAVKAFNGRTRMVLDDGHGGSADIVIDTSRVLAAFRAAGFPPRPGTRITVHGTVAARSPIPGAPRGIDAHAIRVVQ
ncbi:hypothetical protein ACFXI6_14385 [Streptomyces mirabilis]|uniref:hypothetical protein n=1 Tax=Streptomyces mirabilis TaxID=68239 RepID=UPI0036A64627